MFFVLLQSEIDGSHEPLKGEANTPSHFELYWHYLNIGKMRYTKEEFVRRATARHGNKYNYDKVVYVGSQVKVEIVCPEHGSFWQEPASHLRGRGCQMCNPHHKIDTSEFIRRGNAKHNNKYDYSLSDYKDNLS